MPDRIRSTLDHLLVPAIPRQRKVGAFSSKFSHYFHRGSSMIANITQLEYRSSHLSKSYRIGIMHLPDARSGGYRTAIVLLAYILPVGQEHQCQGLGNQSTPIDCVEQPRHALRGLHSIEIRALCTVHVGWTSHLSYRRGSIPTSPPRQSARTVDRVPNPLWAWLWQL